MESSIIPMENLPIKKRKHRYASGTCLMENLPQEITLEILYRLPVDSVLRCTLVCKTWETLVHNNYFADMHYHRQLQLLKQHGDNEVEDDDNNDDRQYNRLNINGGTVGLGLLLWLEKGGTLGLHYDDLNNMNNDDRRQQQQHNSYKKLLTRMYKIPFKTRADLVGSCNGLICFSIPSATVTKFNNKDPIYICNPITREHAKLPRLTRKYSESRIVSGFGYHPSTNKYKVVRVVYYPKDEGRFVGHVQVYTLGEGSGWRNKGKIRYSLFGPPGIPMNGALHWMEVGNWKVVRFDLGAEEFRLLPAPPFVHTGERNIYKLRELGRCLCAVHGDLRAHGSVDVWSLKKKKGNYSNKMGEQDYHSWSWTREFSIDREGFGLFENNLNRDLLPLYLTKSGEVLLRHNKERALSLYDPKTTTTETIANDDMDLKFFDAIPHMNSFVSLSALGENSERIRRSQRLRERNGIR